MDPKWQLVCPQAYEASPILLVGLIVLVALVALVLLVTMVA